MAEQMITCPKCGEEIELTEALTETIRHSLRADVEVEAAKVQSELLKRKKAMAALEKELSAREQAMDEAVEDKLRAEREALQKATLKKAEKEFGAKAKSLEAELEEKAEKLAKAEQKELAFLKQQRELEKAKQNLDLEVERKLAEVSKKLQADALETAAQAQELRVREKDDLIGSLKKQMAEMQRSAEVGSQEAQGEALEGQLQDTLSAAFPVDSFDEVKKGARGADILQTVRNSSGTICGHILWESKNTKQFQKPWIAKLKKDQQAANADVAVLMSMALPEGVKDFAFSEDDDIWLTRYQSAIPLCTALRHGLIQVARQKIVSEHRDTFKDLVYDYVTGQDFARLVRAIADAHRQMQQDLESEKRSMNRIWSKREKQIAVVLDNVTRMHGELEGLAGPDRSLPGVETLMLESVAPEEDDEDDAEIA